LTDTGEGNWWFHSYDARLFGIKCNHQASPWIGSYGDFVVSATITDPNHGDPNQFSSYIPGNSQWSPYYWNASLLAYGTRAGNTAVELTATSHGAVIRVTYPPYTDDDLSSGFNQTRRILVLLDNPGTENVAVDSGNSNSGVAPWITGFSSYNSGGVAGTLKHYFNLTVSGGVNGDIPVQSFSSAAVFGGQLYAYLDFLPTDPNTQVLTLRIGTSLISQSQANLNLDREIGLASFDDIMMQAKMDWRQTLSRANIVDPGSAYSPQQQQDYLTVFYSSLWRAAQMPRKLFEQAENGTDVHWSPYDPNNGVYSGPLSADSGAWDAYRTIYPYLSVLYPQTLGVLLQGWINAAQETAMQFPGYGGWLPKWASPGHRQSIVGTMLDVSFADAIIKGIGGFDVDAAYEYIRKDAFTPPPPGVGNVGRTCLQPYVQNGYVPSGAIGATGVCTEEVSRTQNYWLSDWSIAQAAQKLGKTSDAEILLSRANNYSLLFEPKTGFFRTREPNSGPFVEPFDEFAWGSPYTEAGPWQYRFYIPYDPQGLKKLYSQSGASSMCDRLQEMQTMPSSFHVGAYGTVIHEMTEMSTVSSIERLTAGSSNSSNKCSNFCLSQFSFHPSFSFISVLLQFCWGQYEHDNQPVHHVLWMFIQSEANLTAACASQGQYWLRKVMTELYKPGADMFCGDEDNGQMAAWYVLASMGIYSLAPGSTDMVLGAPLFAHMQVTVEGTNATIDIVANNQGPNNVYVQSVSWNGKNLNGTTIPYVSLMEGGTLTFQMSDTPADTVNTKTPFPGMAGSQQKGANKALGGGVTPVHHPRLRTRAGRTKPAAAPSKK
jgi:predicted alpha-1,2-mannosidase